MYLQQITDWLNTIVGDAIRLLQSVDSSALLALNRALAVWNDACASQ